jgi:hypothetical protein
MLSSADGCYRWRPAKLVTSPNNSSCYLRHAWWHKQYKRQDFFAKLCAYLHSKDAHFRASCIEFWRTRSNLPKILSAPNTRQRLYCTSVIDLWYLIVYIGFESGLPVVGWLVSTDLPICRSRRDGTHFRELLLL